MIFEIMVYFAMIALLLTGALFIFAFSEESFVDKHKKIMAILFVIIIIINIIWISGAIGLSITRSEEVIESNCIISNETIDSLVDFNPITGYGQLNLFGINYVIHKDSSLSHVVICGDKVETVYFGGYLRDPDTIRYKNQYYIIYHLDMGATT